MMRLLVIVMFCIALQGSVFALGLESVKLEQENVLMSKKSHCGKREKCCPGRDGKKGAKGLPGDPGPDFGQYACLYSSVNQIITQGNNVLFANQISLAGISYDSTTGVFTLQPGTYYVTYFSIPVGGLNLVANGSIVPNSPLGGCVTILKLSNESNTLALQALANINLPTPDLEQCNAMITIYRFD